MVEDAPRRSVSSLIVLTCLEWAFLAVSWAVLPARVIARLLFARTRRMPMSMADEINYINPRITSAVEGRNGEIQRTTNARVFSETALTALKCAVGRAPRVEVPGALRRRHFPEHYLVPFHAQPNGYLSSESPVFSERIQESMYGESLHLMRREAALALGQARSSGVILDLGAGAGTFLRTLRSEHYLARLFGIELSPYMIAAAYAHQLDGLDDHVEMVESDIVSLPFEDGSARGITACFVLHELPEQATKAALKEAVRVLAERGRFVILDYSAESGPFSRISAHVRARVFFDPYRRAFLDLDLKAYLERLGLKTVEQRQLRSGVSLLVFEKPALSN